MQTLLILLMIAQPRNVHGVARVGNNVWICIKDTLGPNVYYSPNAGQTWEERGAFYGCTYPELWDIEFYDENTGWAVGWSGIIFGTTDGGQTWTLQLPGGPKHFGRVKFLDANVGWAAGGDAFYGRTTDGGNTWTFYLTVPGIITDLYGVAAFDSMRAWMVGGMPAGNPGGQGLIVYTEDGGQTWQLIDSSSVYEFLDVFFIDENTGWIVGGLDTIPYTPIILYTSDGGATFEDRTPDSAYTLRAVQFINENEGWAVGKYGTIIHTTDGGLTWERQNSGVTVTLFDVEFINELEGTAVGDSGVVLFTEDGGNTWELRSPVGVNEDDHFEIPEGVKVLPRENGFAIKFINNFNGTIQVFNVEGRQLRKVDLCGSSIEIKGLAPGIYFVKASSIGTFKALVLP